MQWRGSAGRLLRRCAAFENGLGGLRISCGGSALAGVDPTTPGLAEADMPWLLVGPVLPGDKPAPLPSLPAGTYPAWNATEAYVAGTRVLLDGVPYQANWWTQGQWPAVAVVGGSPWTLVFPT